MLFHVLVNYGAIIKTAIFRYITDELFLFNRGNASRDSEFFEIIPSIDDEGVESNMGNEFILDVLNFLLRLTDLQKVLDYLKSLLFPTHLLLSIQL